MSMMSRSYASSVVAWFVALWSSMGTSTLVMRLTSKELWAMSQASKSLSRAQAACSKLMSIRAQSHSSLSASPQLRDLALTPRTLVRSSFYRGHVRLASCAVVVTTIRLVVAVVISTKLYSACKSDPLRRILSLLGKPLVGLLRSRLYLSLGLLCRSLVIAASLPALISRVVRSPTIATLEPSNKFRVMSGKSWLLLESISRLLMIVSRPFNF